MSVNQSVIFTKPVHHQGIDLDPERLAALARSFFESNGLHFILHRSVTGPELAARTIIKQHYLMYSEAACAEELQVTDAGKAVFEKAFGCRWEDEVAAGRILSTKHLLETAKISTHQLFNRWNGLFGAGKTVKLQDGFIMGWLEDLELYCVNAFYPSMEDHFYHPDTIMHYFVAEFDSDQVSWKTFRKQLLGATNSSNAVPSSFRGQLYHEYPVQFPGRDNFVHGSAGPLEGFIERSIHEPEFDMASNPIGRYLMEKGISLDAFRDWKAARSITEIGDLFDETEEIDTDDALLVLDKVHW